MDGAPYTKMLDHTHSLRISFNHPTSNPFPLFFFSFSLQNSIVVYACWKKKFIMPKKQKYKDVDRPELHIIHYLSHLDYSLRYLTCDHPLPPDRYNDRVEEHLRFTGFLHVSQIGVVQCQKALVNELVERWHPDTHTFHLLVGECAVTLKDAAVILRCNASIPHFLG
ncbi:serine/threonine-protein phosphatase 7 long form homolog [Arachis ipaensis]|uniref:serine/threonine-protein phosphatase 7 long form homolog n=1 Tax=Arachis ipaensis TaxID=130454 RepID=UPI000A2B0CB5|nr:serine/threonine-protein phosphatase 7 long form homolog [Arachis ipaensis]